MDLVKQIQDALGTAEEGEALVEVARNAHKAELEAAGATKVWVLVCKTFDPDCAGVIDVFATKELALEEMQRCYTEEAEGGDDAAPFSEAVTHYTGGDGCYISYTDPDDVEFTWEITSHVVFMHK